MANQDAEQNNRKVIFNFRNNSRKLPENFFSGRHLSIPEIKQHLPKKPKNLKKPDEKDMWFYLHKEIPNYPNPVEFKVSKVSHVTDNIGFERILDSGKFRPPEADFSWWDLYITDDEIQSAENYYLETMKKNQSSSKRKSKLLKKFTTSPLFDLKSSRYGNYRFTFPLGELMNVYREQNCDMQDPVVRIYETITHKQEIVYVVLIHSPEDNEKFRELPLAKSDWVSYDAHQDSKDQMDNKIDYKNTENDKIIWKAQAICETHWYELSPELKARKLRKNRQQYYVWDQVSIIFHLPRSKALKFPKASLIEALDACKLADIDLSKHKSGRKSDEQRKEDYEKAIAKVAQQKRNIEDEKQRGEDVKTEMGVQEINFPKTESADNKKKIQKRQKTETSLESKARRFENAGNMEDIKQCKMARVEVKELKESVWKQE